MSQNKKIKSAVKAALHNPKRAVEFTYDGEKFVVVGKQEWDLRKNQSARMRAQDFRLAGRFKVE